jgi:hypothetical protein
MFSKNNQISNFLKICLVPSRVVQVRTDRLINTAKQIVIFRNFADAPENTKAVRILKGVMKRTHEGVRCLKNVRVCVVCCCTDDENMCEKRVLASSWLSVRLSVLLSTWYNSAPTGRILITLDI